MDILSQGLTKAQPYSFTFCQTGARVDGSKRSQGDEIKMIRQFPPEDQQSAKTSAAMRSQFLAKVSFLQNFFQLQQSFFAPGNRLQKS
jgi:hypothetical protein